MIGEPRAARSVNLALPLLCALAALYCDLANADVTLTGNTHGNPVKSQVDDPCPAHGAGTACWSQVSPTDVQLLTSVSDWFKTTILASYPSSNGWSIHYMDGNANLKGEFSVTQYYAYNECPGLLGAQIDVDFKPAADSLIQDVLWVQGIQRKRDGTDNVMDDYALLQAMGNVPAGKNVMPGPFYPFQDEDETGGWQSSYDYDDFWDRPGGPCPTPVGERYRYYETYAVWWDDRFTTDASGNVIVEDLGTPGHNVYVHEGFAWGYESHCVPESAAVTMMAWALVPLALVVARRRKA